MKHFNPQISQITPQRNRLRISQGKQITMHVIQNLLAVIAKKKNYTIESGSEFVDKL